MLVSYVYELFYSKLLPPTLSHCIFYRRQKHKIQIEYWRAADILTLTSCLVQGKRERQRKEEQKANEI